MNLHKAISLFRVAAILPIMLLSGACSTLEHSAAVNLDRNARWVILPVANYSDTPQAGLRLENLLESLLRSKGIDSVRHYPLEIGADLMLDLHESKAVEQAHGWAKAQGARYGVTGAVNEWRYKVGVDGEPAVGISLQIVSLDDGKVLYSASGARTGWSREAVSAIAQKLIGEMLSGAGLK